MKYALTAEMAKKTDQYTIGEMNVPSLVLMERAALAVANKTAEVAVEFNRAVRIAAVCGCKNNGADGIAAARILAWQGMNVDIIVVGNPDHATEEFRQQTDIAMRSGLVFTNISAIREYDIIIDALFGTGLTGEVKGEYAALINEINAGKNIVVSVDVPSGINTTTGRVAGVAVKADITVTFGYNKTGLLMYEGKGYAGEVVVADIGLCPEALKSLNPPMYFTPDDILRIPARIPDANKGTYGRCVVIAGSEEMSGAAYLSAVAAYRTGVGLVEIVTHEKNEPVIKSLLPEAIVVGYRRDNATEVTADAIEKADVIILGPGLSRSDTAQAIVGCVMDKGRVPVIIDADALNIIAADTSVLKRYESTVIITPHIGEMMRLTGMSKEDILSDSVKAASDFAVENGVICVMKNAVTVACEPDRAGRTYINTSGCAAMAKAGMGDVLTGIIAGMLLLSLEPFSAAAMGVYVHGIAGEMACSKQNEHSVLATDLIKELGRILKNR